jgi:hypothetical protein
VNDDVVVDQLQISGPQEVFGRRARPGGERLEQIQREPFEITDRNRQTYRLRPWRPVSAQGLGLRLGVAVTAPPGVLGSAQPFRVGAA